MSDGMSDSYSINRAQNSFESLWKEAQVDQILLGIENEMSKLSIDEILDKLQHNNTRIILNSTMGISSVDIYTKQGVRKSFTCHKFPDGLKDALLFCEWLNTEDGKRAIKIYHSW